MIKDVIKTLERLPDIPSSDRDVVVLDALRSVFSTGAAAIFVLDDEFYTETEVIFAKGDSTGVKDLKSYFIVLEGVRGEPYIDLYIDWPILMVKLLRWGSNGASLILSVEMELL